jgi:hypothetical protein
MRNTERICIERIKRRDHLEIIQVIWKNNTKCGSNNTVRGHIEFKNTDHQQMHKESFIINRNTFLHLSTLLGHLQGELFCYRYTKVARYSWGENVLLTVYCVVNSLRSESLRSESSRLQKQRSTQSTAHSHSNIKCNLSVTITKKFSLKMTQQGRNTQACVTIDVKTLFVHLLVISVFV